MVSVVIPTHNRCDLLPRAIRSVQEQTIKDLEIIVVSDGSTDSSDTIMEKIKKEDPRINYISYYPGRNGNFARNTGIKAAKGEYIAFLDDDDEWFPTKLEEQLVVMESDANIGLVYTGTHSIFVDDGLAFDSKPIEHGDLSRRILMYNMVGSTTTVMVRRSVLEESGLFDESLAAIQDYDLWVRICQIAKVGVVSKPLVHYYNYNSTGQISANVEKYEKAYQQVNEKYKDLLESKLSAKEYKQKLAIQKRSLGMRHLRNGNGNQAREYYRESLRIKYDFRTIQQYFLSFLGYKTMLKMRSYLS